MAVYHNKRLLADIFLFILLAGSLYLVYLFFQPFLVVIVISAVLTSIFYNLYSKLSLRLNNHRSLAALIMIILIAIIIILPLTELIFYLAKESVDAFGVITAWVNSGNLEQAINNGLLHRFNFIDPSAINIRQYLISISATISNVLVTGGRSIITGTTQFITALVIMFFTMFFMFRDGKKMLERLMYLTPLPNKYDREIFKKFRDVSYSSIVSTFIAAIVQGIIGAIGFAIVGVPAFFAGVIMSFCALLPLVGAAIVWFPMAIYLLLIGKIWQGIFLLIWGFAVVSVIDNIVRPYLIKGRAQVHPLIIFFSIFGGVIVFGFWGLIIGPIVISIFFTLLHIYEMEYQEILEK